MKLCPDDKLGKNISESKLHDQCLWRQFQSGKLEDVNKTYKQQEKIKTLRTAFVRIAGLFI